MSHNSDNDNRENIVYGAFDNNFITEAADKRPTQSGSGGDGGGIEQRLSAVEGKLDIAVHDIAGLKKDTAEIKELALSHSENIQKISANLAEIKGRLANMPTTLQWLSIIIGLIFTIMGLSFAIIRFGAAH